MMKRNTIQRSLILEAVRTLKCHATADEVYAEIAVSHPHISKGTVYRNLHQLAENGDVRKVEVPGGADRFDHQCYDHYHVKCLKCGRVFDVDIAYIPNLEDAIKDSQGFTFTGHDVMFRGICPKCKQ